MTYPKILIFGQPFNNYSGGGITLTNLFKGWPKDSIAVAYIGHGLQKVTTDVCDTFYQLGAEEHRWIFPFNLIQRKFVSGLKSIEPVGNSTVNSFQGTLRYTIVNKYFFPLLRWLGFFYFSTEIVISERLRTWLEAYSPEVIYLQVAARDEINFARKLIEHLKIPAVIHIMDDWPSTIGRKGLFSNYWSVKIDKEFRSLLKLTKLQLSISEAMTMEYEKRYKLRFIPFHNPINVDAWLKHSKKDFHIDKQNIKILYSGRIGDNGIAESIIEVAEAIDALNVGDDFKIKLYIQTPSKRKDILYRLARFECIVFNPFVEYSLLPTVFSNVDILLLANDFNSKGVNYLKFSMPTKATEYMISGTPVFVYTPPLAAVSEFFRINECGYCLTRQDRDQIIESIVTLIQDEELRKKISRNAVAIANNLFEAGKVRSKFQQLLVNL